MCSFCIGFGNVSDSLATTIFPVVARRIFRVKRNRAGDAAGAAVDGFKRRIEFEDRVVDALRILEIEGFRRGINCRGAG